MEMGFAPSGLASAPASADAPLVSPDWHAMKSRFDAAHALRRELAREAEGNQTCGSFVQAGTQMLMAIRESSNTVNLTASANGKGQTGIVVDVTGNPTPMTGECYD